MVQMYTVALAMHSIKTQEDKMDVIHSEHSKASAIRSSGLNNVNSVQEANINIPINDAANKPQKELGNDGVADSASAHIT